MVRPSNSSINDVLGTRFNEGALTSSRYDILNSRYGAYPCGALNVVTARASQGPRKVERPYIGWIREAKPGFPLGASLASGKAL